MDFLDMAELEAAFSERTRLHHQYATKPGGQDSHPRQLMQIAGAGAEIHILC